MNTEIVVTLQQVGDQPSTRAVDSLVEASRVAVEFQDDRGMGASDCTKKHGRVSVGGKVTHRVAYNGKVVEL